MIQVAVKVTNYPTLAPRMPVRLSRRVISLAHLRLAATYSHRTVVVAPHRCVESLRASMRSQRNWLSFLLLVFPTTQLASAQTPRFTPAGVVSAASYAQPISPGSAVSIFGINLAAREATASHTPLPTDLAGTSVTINGVKAPLFFVSPNQINLQAPSSLTISRTNYESSSIVVTTEAGVSDAVQVPLYETSPAVFAMDASGCGAAAATNDASGGAVSLNSVSNSAAPGDHVTLYASGLG
jgi:hypothetical protein